MMSGSRHGFVRKARCRADEGFTLLEVMVASGILFVCLFAVLGLLANTLRNARALQRVRLDASMVAAQLSLTNKLAEGVDSGDFRDFGNAYRDLQWQTETFLAETNGLFAVDCRVFRRRGGGQPESQMTILLFRPESTVTPMGGRR